MEVTFKIKDAKTIWGEQVCIIGNHEQLGSWDVNEA